MRRTFPLAPALTLLAVLLVIPAAPSLLAWTPTCGMELGPLRLGLSINLQEVAELQARLQTLAYYSGPADGVFTVSLERAVRQFQADHALTPNGIVDDATWHALAGSVVPAGTGTSPKPEGELHIVINTRRLQLTLYADGKSFKSYPIAVGKQIDWNWSPVGEWRIVSKGLNWGGGFGTRWMGLNVPWGIYGIHGTNKPYSIGTRASGGCIRMYNRDVEELYSWVPLGTKVVIEGDIPRVTVGRTLASGATGRDVVLVQQRLQSLGFLSGSADGRWGPVSEEAARSLQQLFGLPADGQIYTDVYYLLGLK